MILNPLQRTTSGRRLPHCVFPDWLCIFKCNAKVVNIFGTTKLISLNFVKQFHISDFWSFYPFFGLFSGSGVSSLQSQTFKPIKFHFQACKLLVSLARRRGMFYMIEIVKFYRNSVYGLRMLFPYSQITDHRSQFNFKPPPKPTNHTLIYI